MPSWPATTNPLSTSRTCSTGDFGDSEREFVAFNANPVGSCCTPAAHISKRRLRTDNYLQMSGINGGSGTARVNLGGGTNPHVRQHALRWRHEHPRGHRPRTERLP